MTEPLSEWARRTKPARPNGKPTFWWSHGRHGRLCGLLESATRELQKEDGNLREALASAKNQRWTRTRPHGLTYWVYEHNLVYPIFRSWVRLADQVEWDESQVPRQTRSRGTPSRAERRGRTGRGERKFVDLVVCLDDDVHFFEAKWWAYGSARRVLESDVQKLRSLKVKPPVAKTTHSRRFLLTFWYGTNSEIKNDFAKAEGQSRTLGIEPVFAGMFGTSLYTWWVKAPQEPTRENGYFALVAFEVLSERQR